MQTHAIPSGRLTIGVAAHGGVDITIECLQSIFAAVSGDFDLILVDDASEDDVMAVFQQALAYHPRTRIFRFDENKEYSHSVNCILTEATTEFTLFVSNDVLITPAYVKALLEVMADGKIGIARGMSNFVDGFLGSPLHNLPITTEITSLDDLFALAEKLYGGNRPWATDDLLLTGDAFMVRGDLAHQIGGFDTRYHGYMSDMDFGIRAVRAGYRKIVCGHAFAWHAERANIAYLPAAEQELKWQKRRYRVAAAWQVFRSRWDLTDLPEEWEGTLLRSIPYAQLESCPFNIDTDVAVRQNYLSYLVSQRYE